MASPRPVSHKVLTLNGSAQQLSAELGLAGVRVKMLSLQAGAANAAPFYIGGPLVSASVYGVRVPIPVTNIPAAPFMIEDDDESTSMDDWWVIGTNTEVVHCLIIAYV